MDNEYLHEKFSKKSCTHPTYLASGLKITSKGDETNLKIKTGSWNQGDSIFLADLCAIGVTSELNGERLKKPDEILIKALFSLAVQEFGFEEAKHMYESSQNFGAIGGDWTPSPIPK